MFVLPPMQATLTLSARHEAGQVIIEVTDDGAGIDPRQIKDKALTMGLYDRAHLEAMSDKELVRLIFLPGFSMAKQVTDISGRGVGLDVVHTNLTKLGGTIDIESQVGRRCTFRIKLPLTLAIIPCLLVAVGAERYALPQVNLVELIRVPAAQVAHRLEAIGSALVMRHRGSLLPIVHLGDRVSQVVAEDQHVADVVVLGRVDRAEWRQERRATALEVRSTPREARDQAHALRLERVHVLGEEAATARVVKEFHSQASQ